MLAHVVPRLSQIRILIERVKRTSRYLLIFIIRHVWFWSSFTSPRISKNKKVQSLLLSTWIHMSGFDFLASGSSVRCKIFRLIQSCVVVVPLVLQFRKKTTSEKCKTGGVGVANNLHVKQLNVLKSKLVFNYKMYFFSRPDNIFPNKYLLHI